MKPETKSTLEISPGYRQVRRRLLGPWVWLMLGITAAINIAGAQELKDEVFAQAKLERAAAEAVDAALLSPQSFAEGLRLYEQADADFDRGRNLKKIKSRLVNSIGAFKRASENARQGALTFKSSLNSRNDAIKVEAGRLAPSDWIRAEETFRRAARALEDDKLKQAREANQDATKQFRTAELNAIRTATLGEAWRLIAAAGETDAERYAPRTYLRAQNLARKADEAIAEDRYNLTKPMRLAASAEYEGRHAASLSSTAQRVKKNDLSVEDLVLDWESAVADIARAAGVEPELAEGHEPTSSEIVTAVTELSGLRADLADRDELIAGLEDEIRDLDTALGGASKDRDALVRRLEERRRVQEQFRQVESMFTPEEASVLRDGNNLILRLVGLGFASASDKLGAPAGALLEKVGTAIEVFPGSELVVEGHTDSVGRSEQNLRLSVQRAQSVQKYLINQMRIPSYRIKSIGYGDARPVANNRTAEGRAQNRRIDLIILPGAESL